MKEVLTVQADLREIIKKLNEEEQFQNVAVEIIDNDLAKGVAKWVDCKRVQHGT